MKLLNINYLDECIVFELNIKNKLCIISALCRPPSQSHSEFLNFTTSLELVLGDVNAKNKVWFDQDKTTTEGTVFNDLMVQHGPTQIIHEPTHLHDCSYSLC